MFINEYLSNCSCETGGRTHLSGFRLLAFMLMLFDADEHEEFDNSDGDGVEEGRENDDGFEGD